MRFDLDRLTVLSDAIPVVDRVTTLATGSAQYDVAHNGTIVFMPGSANAVVGVPRSLLWVDRTGREEAIDAEPRTYVIPRLSPDGSQIALDIRDQENDIWIWTFDLKAKTLTKLTFNPAGDGWPVWTPDGKRIIFASTRDGGTGVQNVFWQSADGTGTPERLTNSSNVQLPHSISPDGANLILQENGISTNSDVVLLSLEELFKKPATGKLETRRSFEPRSPNSGARYHQTAGGSPTTPPNRGGRRSTFDHSRVSTRGAGRYRLPGGRVQHGRRMVENSSIWVWTRTCR